MVLQIWSLVTGLIKVQCTMFAPETKDKTKEYKEVTGGRSHQSLNSPTVQ